MGRDRDCIAGMQDHRCVFPFFAEVERPRAGVDIEEFGCVMAVLRIDASGRLACAANIETMGHGNVDVLVRIFRHAGADDREVFLLVGTGRACVDKRVKARLQLAITHNLDRSRFCALLHSEFS